MSGGYQPGLWADTVDGCDGGLAEAAQATITDLEARGLIGPEHQLTTRLLLTLAHRAGIGLQAHKTSIATTHLLRLLLDTLSHLPSAAETGGDAWAVFAAELARIETRIETTATTT